MKKIRKKISIQSAELLEVNEEKVHANFTVNTTYTRAPILTVSIDK